MPTLLLLSGIMLASVLLPLPAQNGRIAGIPDFCPFYCLTGLPCPTCGLTRAFVCIGHGQWAQSLHWHPLGLPIYLLFAFLCLRAWMIFARGEEWMTISPPAARRATVIGFGFVIFVGAARIFWLHLRHIAYL